MCSHSTYELRIIVFSSSEGGVNFNQYCCSVCHDETTRLLVFSVQLKPTSADVRGAPFVQLQNCISWKERCSFSALLEHIFFPGCFCFCPVTCFSSLSWANVCFFPAVIRMPASSTASLRALTT
ncbi:hypothetical protein ATANTOWER_011042 [Ataeniobius toweri]|uniref:Uncharacterized protein n=1 Tax=Ataeniobius toweri TaxID=208326 RepID=A0ABU7BYP5_9TELE|nr:hypothetical protein [Ataeniobius toweri]